MLITSDRGEVIGYTTMSGSNPRLNEITEKKIVNGEIKDENIIESFLIDILELSDDLIELDQIEEPKPNSYYKN